MDVFGEAQLGVIIGLTELADTEKDTPQNQVALEALRECLRDVLVENNLFGVCNSLVSLANSGEKVNTGGFLNGGKIVSTKDIALLRVGLKELLNLIPELENGEVKRAISIAQPRTIDLFMKTWRGGKYYYWDYSGQVKTKASKYFQGIPQEMWPRRNGKEQEEPRIDFRINAYTGAHTYNALLQLEKAEQEANSEQSSLKKSSIMERVRGQKTRRKGEAKFFLEHLPPKLKEKVIQETSRKEISPE